MFVQIKVSVNILFHTTVRSKLLSRTEIQTIGKRIVNAARYIIRAVSNSIGQDTNSLISARYISIPFDTLLLPSD
jgi:hypothetical protein